MSRRLHTPPPRRRSALGLPLALLLAVLYACGEGPVLLQTGKGSSSGNDDSELHDDKADSPSVDDSGEGAWDDGLQPEEPTGPYTPVLVVLGGYTSCGKTAVTKPDPIDQMMTPLFAALRDFITKDSERPPAYVLSCYNLNANEVTYELSTDAGKAKTDTLDTLREDIRAVAAAVEQPRLFIIGHSYGGWTAMDLVMRLPKDLAIGGFVTLDPISKVTCTPKSFVSHIADKDGSGCREPPSDFAPSQISGLAKRVRHWGNYYQVSSKVLHSGPLNGADNNVRAYEGTGFAPHNALVTDPEVIGIVQHLFSAKKD